MVPFPCSSRGGGHWYHSQAQPSSHTHLFPTGPPLQKPSRRAFMLGIRAQPCTLEGKHMHFLSTYQYFVLTKYLTTKVKGTFFHFTLHYLDTDMQTFTPWVPISIFKAINIYCHTITYHFMVKVKSSNGNNNFSVSTLYSYFYPFYLYKSHQMYNSLIVENFFLNRKENILYISLRLILCWPFICEDLNFTYVAASLNLKIILFVCLFVFIV